MPESPLPDVQVGLGLLVQIQEQMGFSNRPRLLSKRDKRGEETEPRKRPWSRVAYLPT